MNTRIQAIIESLGIKKSDFSKKIGISSPFVSELCSGAKAPSERTIKDICDKFHVNEDWLRYGEGEMFLPRSREDEIETFFGQIADGPDNFKKRLVSILASLGEAEWELLEKMALKLAEDEKKSGH